jgi:hypothetical protein
MNSIKGGGSEADLANERERVILESIIAKIGIFRVFVVSISQRISPNVNDAAIKVVRRLARWPNDG